MAHAYPSAVQAFRRIHLLVEGSNLRTTLDGSFAGRRGSALAYKVLLDQPLNGAAIAIERSDRGIDHFGRGHLVPANFDAVFLRELTDEKSLGSPVAFTEG